MFKTTKNRNELNLIVVNIVLLLLLLSICVGCSKSVESDLNLRCEGKHTSTFMSKVDFIKPWIETLSFKDKKRYSIERSEYLSDKCQVWTSENIQCTVEKREEQEIGGVKISRDFLSSYTINRVTGDVKVTIKLNEDEDFYTGTCTKIEGKKF